MTDPEKMALKGAEYSPLNNISSGEEVEQFALPIYPNPVDRPKRRRKRRDFDSLKTKAISTAKHHGASCSCYTCFTIILFLIIISTLCGLGFTCVTLSQNVEELQNLLSDLKEGKSNSDSEVYQLKSDMADLEGRITVNADALRSINYSLTQLNTTLSSMQHQLTSLSTNTDHDGGDNKELAGLKDQLATFGSDVDTLKSDVSTLKQTDASHTGQLSTLSQKIDQMFVSEYTTVPPGTIVDGAARLTLLESRISDINSTFQTQISGFRDLLTKTGSQYESHLTAVANLRDVMESRFGELQSEFESLQNQTVNPSLPSADQDESDEEATLTHRVDQLETFVHQVSQQLQDDIVSQTDNKIVNLTITSGIEDIMMRAFNTRFSEMKDSVDKLRSSVSKNNNQLSMLDSNYMGVTRSVFDLQHQITLLSNPQNSSSSLTSSSVTPNSVSVTKTISPTMLNATETETATPHTTMSLHFTNNVTQLTEIGSISSASLPGGDNSNATESDSNTNTETTVAPLPNKEDKDVLKEILDSMATHAPSESSFSTTETATTGEG